MKKSNLDILNIAIAAILPLFLCCGCSEKAQKATEVIKEQSEDKLVQIAGEGEVALKLSQQQYADLKEKLVRIKTLQTTMGRQMNEANADSQRLRQEGKTAQADANAQRAATYAKNLKFLNEREPAAEAALRDYAAVYEDQKEQIKLLKTEVEVYKASGSLTDKLTVDSPLTRRAETIQELTDKLREQGARAKALFEVGQLEETLKR
jgi:murein L,D-transpeptidase YcbB/YkuD